MTKSIQNIRGGGEAIVRNTVSKDISKIVDLQKESFPYLACYGNIWRPEELESHIRIFLKDNSSPLSQMVHGWFCK